MTDDRNEWKLLSEIKPAMGQLVEYYGDSERSDDKTYSQIDMVPIQGKFIPDCGTHWTENLAGFTTEKLGVIVSPDPTITYWQDITADQKRKNG